MKNPLEQLAEARHVLYLAKPCITVRPRSKGEGDIGRLLVQDQVLKQVEELLCGQYPDVRITCMCNSQEVDVGLSATDEDAKVHYAFFILERVVLS